MDCLDSLVQEYIEEWNGNPKFVNTIKLINESKKRTLYEIMIEKNLINKNLSNRKLAKKLFVSKDTINRMSNFSEAIMLDDATVMIILAATNCSYKDAVDIIEQYYGIRMAEAGYWGIYDKILNLVCNLECNKSVKVYIMACLLYKSGNKGKTVTNILTEIE